MTYTYADVEDAQTDEEKEQFELNLQDALHRMKCGTFHTWETEETILEYEFLLDTIHEKMGEKKYDK